MKIFARTLAFILLLAVVATCCLTACGKQNATDQTDNTPAQSTDGDKTNETLVTPPQKTPAEISESAMDNFLAKIQKGDYTISTEGYLQVSAHSQDLVIFDYADKTDTAYMTSNGDTFKGVLTDDGVTDIEYVANTNALVAVRDRLLTAWIDIADGNMWNVFYNDTQKPLEFISKNADIKNSLMNFAQIGPMVIGSMQEVRLVLDAEDPTVAHVKAAFAEGSGVQDIDVVVTFGSSLGDARAEAWMAAPTYPESRDAWTATDIFTFNSVFKSGYGEKAVPFVSGASYALTITPDLSAEKADIKDPHASEKVYTDYLATLQSAGFVKDEETGAYRILLREEYNAYSKLSVSYDEDGLTIIASLYYDNPHYAGSADVNTVLRAHDFEELPENQNIVAVTAIDDCKQRNEGLWYFFNYDLDLDVLIEFNDETTPEAYAQDYISLLPDKGFIAHYVDGEIDGYKTANDAKLFRYRIEGTALRLLFRSERFVTAEEVKEMVEGAGFPEIDLSAYFSSRNLTKYHNFMNAKNTMNYLTLTLAFENTEAAEAWLEGYITAKIIDDLALLPINPRSLGSQKQNGYGDAERGFAICFDYVADSAMVYIDFIYSMSA